ncbi:MAG TPA: sulfatase-like hydrolase/transferase [Kofleriaceae bacterium]|nr:sulfatase-like hydrolase/transferase [Kofleriaceae bacterium]
MIRLSPVVAALALCACGKSKPHNDEPPTKVGEAAPQKTVAPAVAPQKAPARGPEHPVYSLVDSRLSAHLTRGGGLVLDAGSAGFAKYTRIGNVMKGAKKAWDLRQTEGEIKVAKIDGKSGTVFVPLTAAQVAKGTVRIRAFSPGGDKQPVSLKVNDNKDINGSFDAGWSTLELKVPEGQLHEGENAISIFAKKSGLEVAWIQIGAQTPLADDASVKFYDAGSRSLVIPKDGAMSWFVAVPEKAKLTADLSDGACTVHVTATADDGATADGKLVGTGSAVDLASVAGKAARIDLATEGCPEAHLTNASLVLPGDAPQVKRGDPPKYVVFIVMDSLRADRIRAFNPKARPETPNWDKLAESSTLFMNNYVQGNESQVSHASMWSSNYLAKHKAIEMHDKLADKWMTIDEVAKKAGKYTAGASGNGYIRPARGFGTSWDQFVNHIEKSLGLKGADIMEKGLSFIQPKKDRPWFLYLGFIDTHVTWRAKAPWMDKYDGGYKGRFATEYGDDGPHGSDGKDLTEKEQAHVRALYDSNVSYQDDLVGQLIEKLKTWGIYDQTMIIITADHGDEQWEDGRVGHGGSERETLLHVPLLIHYPPLFPAGKVTEGTEGIDIVPTLADALGVATDPEWQGQSLIPLANGAGGYPLMSFSSQYENNHAGRIWPWKLKLMGTGAPRLYNLAKDPDERNDLWGKASAEVGARLLLDPMWLLRNWNVEWKKSQWGNAADVSSRFASDLGE